MNYKLIYANTKNTDMFYAARTIIPDACFLLEAGQRKFIFLDRRELKAFKEHDTGHKFQAIPIEPFINEASRLKYGSGPSCRLALAIIQKHVPPATEIEVPAHFPLDMADFLRSRKIKLRVTVPFFPERSIKDNFEICAIERSLQKTAVAYRKIEEILGSSVVKQGRIMFEGVILTSEFIKKEADDTLLPEDMVNTEGIIISSGKQASMPHHSGTGPLLPNEPIICDIFPKNRTTGYFADMTRTYVKGKASRKMKLIHEAVLRAQDTAIKTIRPGVTGREVHQACCDSFLRDGYEIGEKGFLHNTGHGLGLDIHELPYLAMANDEPLVAGNVVTVEPGLYYENEGSARIEDVVVVTGKGCKNLTNYPKALEIP